ncbi:MAG: hypothetical protein ABIC57_04005 [bacterium]
MSEIEYHKYNAKKIVNRMLLLAQMMKVLQCNLEVEVKEMERIMGVE